MTLTFIESSEALAKASKVWNQVPELAIDLECDNNLHHYGTTLSLAQISDGKQQWILDLLAVKEPKDFIEVLENPKILKVFHDVDFDFRILHDHLGIKPKNVFDTKIAAHFLNKESVGLGSLFQHYFNIKKVKKFQKADWTKRPLTTAMLEYAEGDVAPLLQLKKLLLQELKQKKRVLWVQEECKALEKKEYTYHDQEWNDVTGIKSLSIKQQTIFKTLFSYRKVLAKRLNKPPFFIINNKILLKLSKEPPSLHNLKTLRGVHPIVKKDAEQVHNNIIEAKNHSITPLPVKKKHHFSAEIHKRLQQLNQKKQELAEELHIPSHLLINKETMITCAKTNSLTPLKTWQKALFKGVFKS